MSKAKTGGRKVTLGTCTLAPFGPGIQGGNDERLANGLAMIDAMAATANRKGTPLDLVVLPEHFAQSGCEDDRHGLAEPLDGRILSAIAEKCVKYRTNAAVSLLLDDGDTFANAVVYLDRTGTPCGTYRKVFPVLVQDMSIEYGVTPGGDFPVVSLDFGTVGTQVCFDVSYTDGWEIYGKRNVDILVYPSATSAVSRLKAHAYYHRYYVVASTFRAPTVIVDPLGGEAGRTSGNKEVLVETVDLDYGIIPWNAARDFGAALKEKYGTRMTQDWHYEEDLCIISSNDPDLPIAELMKLENLEPLDDFLEVNRNRQDEERGEKPASE